MPSRNPADIAFLQQLQQAVAGDDPPGAPADERDVWRPTAHETTDGYAILTQVVDDILPFVLEPDAIDDAPLFGTLALGRPGADLVPASGTDRAVVLVERQFPVLAHLVAKALAAALPATLDGDRLQLSVDDESWATRLTSEHPAVRRFVDVMVATQTTGPAGAEHYLIDPMLDPVVTTVRQAIEWFELAQPYAHFAAGHHRTASRRSWLEDLGRYERFDWTNEQDHEAVARAAMAVLNRSRQVVGDVRMPVWALDSWLTTQMLVAGGPAVVQGLGEEVFDDLVEKHAERRGLVRAMLERDDELRPALVVAAALEPIMEKFWEHTIQALLLLSTPDDAVM